MPHHKLKDVVLSENSSVGSYYSSPPPPSTPTKRKKKDLKNSNNNKTTQQQNFSSQPVALAEGDGIIQQRQTIMDSVFSETPVMQRLQDTVLAMVQKGARLLEGHIQLLATVLRHQSLCISDPGQAAGEQEEQWRDFEENAGKVLLGCLQYLTSTGVKVGKEQVDQEECCTLMVCLCQDLLSLVSICLVCVWVLGEGGGE